MTTIETFHIDLGDGVRREVRFNNRVCRAIFQATGKSVVRGELWASFSEADFPVVLAETLVDKTGVTADLIDELHPSVVADITKTLVDAFNGKSTPDEPTPEKN